MNNRANMTREKVLFEATRFHRAIEKAMAVRKFVPKRPFQPERMNNFPYDCCDDTADLFTHYLYHEFGIDSYRCRDGLSPCIIE